MSIAKRTVLLCDSCDVPFAMHGDDAEEVRGFAQMHGWITRGADYCPLCVARKTRRKSA